MNVSKLSKMFHQMDKNISQFYSSQQALEKVHGCSCTRNNDANQEEIQFYTNQKMLIMGTAQGLLQSRRAEDEKIIGKMLTLSVDYIQRIIELLNKNYLCECKEKKLGEIALLQHKIDFLRLQNEKYFRLCEAKVAECEQLSKQIQKYRQDIRPITVTVTARGESSPLFPLSALSMNSADVQSLSSSKISESKISENQNVISPVHETIKIAITQKSHHSYFQQTKMKMKMKQRKNAIFVPQNSSKIHMINSQFI